VEHFDKLRDLQEMHNSLSFLEHEIMFFHGTQNLYLPAAFFGIIFFDKEYILISQRYQLHLVSAITHYPSDITDAHSQKKKEELPKKKSITTVIKSFKQRH
jgi:hypothetical protein